MESLWSRHILDSVQLLPLAEHATRWLDLGSGGGFPGAVLAICFRGQQASVDLIESNRKKAAFLQTVLGKLSAPGRVHVMRIEDAAKLELEPEIVTARALAPLPELLRLSSPWLCRSSTGLFHKGRDYRAELKESLLSWSFDLVEHRSTIDPDGVVLRIGALRRR